MRSSRTDGSAIRPKRWEQIGEPLLCSRAHCHRLRGCQPPPVRSSGCHDDVPTSVNLAESQALGDPHVVEEHLVECSAAGHLTDRPHRYSALSHGQDKGGQVLMSVPGVTAPTDEQPISLRWAPELHTFCPVTCQVSPSRSARVDTADRSEPATGAH